MLDLSGRAREDAKPRLIARGRRVASDEFGRQLVVEIGRAQGSC